MDRRATARLTPIALGAILLRSSALRRGQQSHGSLSDPADGEFTGTLQPLGIEFKRSRWCTRSRSLISA